MKILGIDPGLATIGWGVVESDAYRPRALAYGSIITPPGIPTERRLSMIYSDLAAIIKEHSPDEMAVEELFWNTNQTTGIRVAEARGVILLCKRGRKVPGTHHVYIVLFAFYITNLIETFLRKIFVEKVTHKQTYCKPYCIGVIRTQKFIYERR